VQGNEQSGGRKIGERGAGEACDEGRPSQSATDKEGTKIGKAMIKINHESVYSRGSGFSVLSPFSLTYESSLVK